MGRFAFTLKTYFIMNKDIIPAGKKLASWAAAFKTTTAKDAAVLGLSTAEVNAIGQWCDEIVEQRAITQQAINNARAMGKKEKQIHEKNIKLIRRLINKMKANQVTTNQLVGIGVKTQYSKPDEKTYAAKIKVDIANDMVRVKFKKYGVDRMEFWGCCNGGPYQRLEIRSRSPFYFKPEPLPGHLPQRWTIKAVAIYRDKPFGTWSQPQTVLYESALDYQE
jgi:hypothetical protein